MLSSAPASSVARASGRRPAGVDADGISASSCISCFFAVESSRVVCTDDGSAVVSACSVCRSAASVVILGVAGV